MAAGAASGASASDIVQEAAVQAALARGDFPGFLAYSAENRRALSSSPSAAQTGGLRVLALSLAWLPFVVVWLAGTCYFIMFVYVVNNKCNL